MNKIAFCTDLLPNSESALNFAIEIAKITKSKIILVHVFFIQITLDAGLPQPAEISDQMEKETQELLNNECKKINANHYLDTTSVLCESFGALEYKLLDKVEEIKPDLIIMGARNVTGLQKLFGTVTSIVAKGSLSPVLVVPEGSEFSGFKNMIYATDLKEKDEVIHRIIEFAKLFNSQLTFLHIDNPGNIGTDHKRFSSYRKNILEHTNYKNIQFDSITYKNTALAINDYSHLQNADLLVLTRHHYPLFEGLFHKSTTQEIIFKAQLPVLVIH